MRIHQHILKPQQLSLLSENIIFFLTAVTLST